MKIHKETGRQRRRIRTKAGEWLWPYRCPVCEKILRAEEGLVCGKCAAALPWVKEPRCMKCGRPVADETQEYCAACEGRERLFHRGMSALAYEGDFRKSVLRMKFHNQRVYIPFFAACMAAGCSRELYAVQPEVLLPVPMHERKKRERGFDQCALLALELSKQTGIPVQTGNLIRKRYTQPQKGLNARQRHENLHGAFLVRSPEALPASVMLIDDIYTTGATIDECCRVLRQAGVREINFMTLCTPRDPQK